MIIPAGLKWDDFKHKKEDANESLQESTKLNEEFSPSMPTWLRSRLLKFNINSRNKSTMDKIASYDKHGYTISKQSPTRNRGHYDWSNIQAAFAGLGIDLAHANFINVPLPAKKSDPIINDTDRYIPIFHLVDAADGVDTIYMKGINDNEEYPGHDFYNNGLRKLMKSLPMKRIYQLTQDFCYIDKQDPSNFMKDTRDARNKLRNDVVNITNYSRNGHHADGKPTNATAWAPYRGYGSKFDKSGYYIEPLKSRYADELKKLGYSKVAKEMDDAYHKILSFKSSISSLMNDWDIMDANDDFIQVIQNNALPSLKEIISIYKELNQSIEAIDKSQDQATKERIISRILENSSWGSTVPRLKNEIAALENRLKEVLPVVMDWNDNVFDEDELGSVNNVAPVSIGESLNEETIGEIAAEAEEEPIESDIEQETEDTESLFDDDPDEELFSKFM